MCELFGPYVLFLTHMCMITRARRFSEVYLMITTDLKQHFDDGTMQTYYEKYLRKPELADLIGDTLTPEIVKQFYGFLKNFSILLRLRPYIQLSILFEFNCYFPYFTVHFNGRIVFVYQTIFYIDRRFQIFIAYGNSVWRFVYLFWMNMYVCKITSVCVRTNLGSILYMVKPQHQQNRRDHQKSHTTFDCVRQWRRYLFCFQPEKRIRKECANTFVFDA